MKNFEVAREVLCLQAGIANCYLVGTSRRWTLVDTGTAGHAESIISVAERRFGKNAVPEAILLTHGHFDHAGSVAELSDYWDVPIYAHRLELPFLDGRSEYPPPDPTVGGFMSFVMRFVPSRNNRVDLGDRVEEIVNSKKLPGLTDWNLIETPGHTPGHVSFFREGDRVLIAGDALTTVNQDSAYDVITKKHSVSRPPVYYTCNWEEAEDSVQKLARLKPHVLAAGHGIPMSGTRATSGLEYLAEHFPVPRSGRYISEPAESNEQGLTYLPPSAPDPLPKIVAGIGAVAVAGTAALLLLRQRDYTRKSRSETSIGERIA